MAHIGSPKRKFLVKQLTVGPFPVKIYVVVCQTQPFGGRIQLSFKAVRMTIITHFACLDANEPSRDNREFIANLLLMAFRVVIVCVNRGKPTEWVDARRSAILGQKGHCDETFDSNLQILTNNKGLVGGLTRLIVCRRARL